MFDEASSISENLSRGSPYKKVEGEINKENQIVEMSGLLTERTQSNEKNSAKIQIES